MASREVWSVFSWVCHGTTGLHSICDWSREGFGTVKRPFPGAPGTGRVSGRAGVGLRAGHPLSRTTVAVRYTFRQWVHVAAAEIGSVIALMEGGRWALSMACSAAGVLLILSVLLAVHLQRERDLAIELILEGRETVPVAAVQHQCRRLVSERTRHGLAGSLEEILRDALADRRLQLRPAPRLSEPMVVRAVANELGDVIVSLRTEEVSARGVAQAERLVEHAVSPLYGHDVSVLRAELSHIRKRLRAER